MNIQITKLRSAPEQRLIRPVRNPPIYKDGDLRQWLLVHYCGNKPTGGLWSSSHTPTDQYTSDWERGLKTNTLIQLAYPNQAGLVGYQLTPTGDAKVLSIASLDDAVEFTLRYHLLTVPLPQSLRPLITPELTDWQKAARQWDGIHLSAEAADEVAWASVHGEAITAFDTWNCESTLWTRWAFDNVTVCGQERNL